MDYEIKEASEINDLLESHNIDQFNDWDYQLKTNHGYVYELEDGRVVFMPGQRDFKGILFNSKESFEQIKQSGKFPIENPSLFQVELSSKRIPEIHNHVEYYKQYLNTKFNLEYEQI